MPSKEQEGRMARAQETVTLWRTKNEEPHVWHYFDPDSAQEVAAGFRAQPKVFEVRDFVPAEELGRAQREIEAQAAHVHAVEAERDEARAGVNWLLGELAADWGVNPEDIRQTFEDQGIEMFAEAAAERRLKDIGLM